MTTEIHPAAEAWPMLTDDELDALAADIAKNGLRHPITTWQGQVIDGRNRLAACERAGIEPTYVEADLADEAAVLAFIESENDKRRHLNKGQRAVALARMYAPNGRWAYGKRKEIGLNSPDSPAETELKRAAFVVGYAGDLAEEVTAGSLGLTAAYDQAKARQREADSAEAKLELLRTEAPNLADMVEADELTLPEAVAALTERRREQEASDRRGAARLVEFLNGYSQAQRLRDNSRRDEILAILADHDRSRFLTIERAATLPEVNA